MTHFSATYGMVGVGIAAAIGFVFALSFVSSTGTVGVNPQAEQSQASNLSLKEPEPSANDQAGQSNLSVPFGEEPSIGTRMLNQSNIHPTFISAAALTSNRDFISEITDGMQFKQDAPVFIQANFENQNDEEILNHTILIGIKSNDGTTSESIANFHGDIAAGSSFAIELYWQPTKEGDYVVNVFSMTPEDLTSTMPVKPLASIAVRVTQ
jgi:hypothetical protein